MKLRTYADVKFDLSLEDAPKTNVIYCLTFPNNKKYIGKTTQSLKERVRCHIKDSFIEKEFNYDMLYMPYWEKIIKQSL